MYSIVDLGISSLIILSIILFSSSGVTVILCLFMLLFDRNLLKCKVRDLPILLGGGFIGMNFYSRFVIPEGQPTMDDVVRHIDAICEMGGEHVLGFGSDFDGIEAWPEGLGDPTGFPTLLNELRKRGYSEQTLADIAGLNMWRMLKESQGVGSRQ